MIVVLPAKPLTKTVNTNAKMLIHLVKRELFAATIIPNFLFLFLVYKTIEHSRAIVQKDWHPKQ